VGDEPGHVEANRVLLAETIGVPRDRLLFMNQVHGADVTAVSAPWGHPAPHTDGIVSTTYDLALAVLVADCVPVLLHDAASGVIGAVHAGRPGLTSGIVGRALDRMRAVGAQRITAVVGPSVCGRCYEVPTAMADAAARVAPAAAARSWSGTPAIDVAAGVVEQLAAAGAAVEWVGGCTREHPDLYSYRRDHRTGRFAGVITMRRPRA
jgi:YfiH family protein